MSRRLQIVVPDPVADTLQQLASASGEPLATLAARIQRDGLALATGQPDANTPKAPASPHAQPDGRPPWLEPYGGSPAWRAEMWGAIVALHARYHRHLEHLSDGWWNDDSRTETLCALAIWRAEIDDMGRDPREELTFQRQLSEFSRELYQHNTGVAVRWQPGAPPADWSDQ